MHSRQPLKHCFLAHISSPLNLAGIMGETQSHGCCFSFSVSDTFGFTNTFHVVYIQRLLLLLHPFLSVNGLEGPLSAPALPLMSQLCDRSPLLDPSSSVQTRRCSSAPDSRNFIQFLVISTGLRAQKTHLCIDASQICASPKLQSRAAEPWPDSCLTFLSPRCAAGSLFPLQAIFIIVQEETPGPAVTRSSHVFQCLANHGSGHFSHAYSHHLFKPPSFPMTHLARS